MRHAATALLVVLIAVGSLSAATFEFIPSDQQLLDRSDLVVVATVTKVSSRAVPNGAIFTDSTLAIERVVKGEAAARTVLITQLGGFANGQGIAVPGSAHYAEGSRVLAFLRRQSDGSFATSFMGLGKYAFARDSAGREILVRQTDGIEAGSGEPFDARPAQQFIDALVSGDLEELAAVEKIAAESLPDLEPRADAASSYVMHVPPAPNRPVRWPHTSAQFVVSGTQGSADVAAATDSALAAWTNDPFSSINLVRSGVPGIRNPDEPLDGDGYLFLDNVNDVIFGRSAPLPGSCIDALGCGFFRYTDQVHSFRGEQFYTIINGDAFIKSSAPTDANSLAGLVTHEVGHALGFRHSNEGTPSSNTAVMRSSNPQTFGANLQAWDQEAAAEVYGEGLPCTAVSITGTSGGGSVAFGASRTLSVSTSGSSPFTYQWYEGATGQTSSPIAGATSSTYITPPITEPRDFWVQVKNCNAANSANSPTISVTPAACDQPVITTQPQSKRIPPGTSTTLTVGVVGTLPFTYEWYEGTTGNTTKRVGTNSSSFTSPTLTTQTSYWVRVKNCNGFGQTDSQTATITIGTQCVPVTIVSQPGDLHIAIGETATFHVAAAGDAPFTYQWYAGEAPDQSNPIAGATGSSYTTPELTTVGETKYWVRVTNACGTANSTTATATVLCPDHTPLNVSTPAITHFSIPYEVSWDGNVEISPAFELQESTEPDFTENLKTFTVTGGTSFTIDAKGPLPEDKRFYYRVRGISPCAGISPYSGVASTVVTKAMPATSRQFSISVPDGAFNIPQEMFIPGFGQTATPGDTFAVTTDAPWLTVNPASGQLPAAGRNVQLSANTFNLEIGTTTATILVTRTQPDSSGAKVGTHGTSSSTLPFSISLVTPVSPVPRNTTPPPGTMIIPAVAHAQGFGARFQSDIRLVNASSQPIEYQLSWTPSGLSGTQTGKTTLLTIAPNDGKGLDDIVRAWYGAGTLGEPGSGTIEIRPLTSSEPFSTFASSRTYAVTEFGTLGQFIPAIPLTQFIGNLTQNPGALLSLQQVANSAAYRTNVGFVEGSGQTVDLLVKLLDANSNVLQQASRTLPPYGHFQTGLANMFGNVPLDDGRLEVQVVSPNGIVSAYASVIDNKTTDPLLVFPAQTSKISTGRYVVPGIADVVGNSRFASDMRIFNGGATTQQLTLNYYPQTGEATPRPDPVNLVIAPGQVLAVDDVLPTLWDLTQTGGAVGIDADPDAALVVTARTYSPLPNDGGTNGQFIPGVTAADAVGVGERAIQVLQLEQSPQYRTNFGLVEVTGKPAVIELTAYKPDSKISAVTQITLQPNEFRQVGFIFTAMGFPNVYNGRISVKVLEGEGRVAAYGSVVDMQTSDPTYVPSQ